MIRIESLTKRFGRAVAVDALTLDIPRGDSVALWGANGAGKTTVIRCVLGLLRFEGRISVDSLDVRRRGKFARRLVAYVPQEIAFYDDLRVAEALRFFAALRGVPIAAARDSLERVGLAGHDRKRVRELSGGMKQRLALAVALLADPPVLVLDEVTASLDACGRHEFISLLSRLSGDGRTLLFASHRVDEVGALAKRVVMLDRGRLTGEIPAHRLLATLGSSSVLHLHVRESLREAAVRHLRAGGFDPRLNGVGLLVPVPPEHKAAPFRVLAQADIPVDDFDLLASAQEARP